MYNVINANKISALTCPCMLASFRLKELPEPELLVRTMKSYEAGKVLMQVGFFFVLVNNGTPTSANRSRASMFRGNVKNKHRPQHLNTC